MTREVLCEEIQKVCLSRPPANQKQSVRSLKMFAKKIQMLLGALEVALDLNRNGNGGE